MNNQDLLAMAFGNLWRRKLRTFLTVLGVLIGTVSIVVMMSLGIAMQTAQEQSIESMGGLSTLEVYPTKYFDSNSGEAIPKEGILNEANVEKIKKIPHVTATLPTVSVNSASIRVGRYQYMGQILGIDPSSLEAFDYTAEQGRLLRTEDKNGILFSSTSGMFFDPKATGRNGPMETPEVDVFKERVTIVVGYDDPSSAILGGQKTSETVKMTAVGVMPPGGYFGTSFVTLDTAIALNKQALDLQNAASPDGAPVIKRQRKTPLIYSNLKVKVDDIDNVESVKTAIKDLQLEASGMSDWIGNLQQQNAIIQGILGGIGSISLLVAAIGIANTMIMSIYERTREIGVMKVIGASVANIRSLFLVEASLIGLLGGVIGLILSYALSALLNGVVGPMLSAGVGGGGMMGEIKISVIPPWLAIVALIFSAFIGLVSGYYPAKKATKLSAIEAIRTE